MALRSTRLKVGLVGPLQSGKTVFLTSLINHPQYHELERFPLSAKTLVASKRH